MTLTVLSHTKDGKINVLIDSIKYEYTIDAGHLRSFLILSRLSPGKALNFLKQITREYRRIYEAEQF